MDRVACLRPSDLVNLFCLKYRAEPPPPLTTLLVLPLSLALKYNYFWSVLVECCLWVKSIGRWRLGAAYVPFRWRVSKRPSPRVWQFFWIALLGALHFKRIAKLPSTVNSQVHEFKSRNATVVLRGLSSTRCPCGRCEDIEWRSPIIYFYFLILLFWFALVGSVKYVAKST